MSVWAWTDAPAYPTGVGPDDAFVVVGSFSWCLVVSKSIRWRGFVDRGEARREWGRSQRARRRRGRFLRHARKQGNDWTWRPDALR